MFRRVKWWCDQLLLEERAIGPLRGRPSHIDGSSKAGLSRDQGLGRCRLANSPSTLALTFGQRLVDDMAERPQHEPDPWHDRQGHISLLAHWTFVSSFPFKPRGLTLMGSQAPWPEWKWCSAPGRGVLFES